MDEIKELFEQGGMKYHFYKHGLCIGSTVRNIKHDVGLSIEFDGGFIMVWKNTQFIKVKRPSMIADECEYCFQVLNEYGEPIGYVYKVKEEKAG